MSINGRQKFGINVKRNGKLPCLDRFTTRTSGKISHVVCEGFSSKKLHSYDPGGALIWKAVGWTLLWLAQPRLGSLVKDLCAHFMFKSPSLHFLVLFLSISVAYTESWQGNAISPVELQIYAEHDSTQRSFSISFTGRHSFTYSHIIPLFYIFITCAVELWFLNVS